jgi:hypothetical protein
MAIPTKGKVMSWRVAKSLLKLRDEIDAAYPHRTKASDGTIGDAAHQAQGSASDHNPWVHDSAGVGVVRALDVTHDPAHGCDTYAIAERMRQAKDHRLTNGGYIISNHRITGPNHDWQWVAYGGSDPHTNHMHVSVSKTQSLYDDTGTWAGVTAPAPWRMPAYPGRVLRLAKPMMTGQDVKDWQHGALLLHFTIVVDGQYGPASEKVCRALQAKLRLHVDGMVGPVTWAATRAAVAKL